MKRSVKRGEREREESDGTREVKEGRRREESKGRKEGKGKQ